MPNRAKQLVETKLSPRKEQQQHELRYWLAAACLQKVHEARPLTALVGHVGAVCILPVTAILCLPPNSEEMTVRKQIHTDIHASSCPLLSLISCKNRSTLLLLLPRGHL